MVGEGIEAPLNKLNESLKWVNDKLADFQKNIIDDNLDKLQISEKLPDLVGKVNGILNINLFGLWTVTSLLWLKLFDISKYKNKKGVLNYVLKKYGGVEWLHKSYIEETLTSFLADQPEKSSAIWSLYQMYKSESQQNICSDVLKDPDSLNVVCNLWLDDKVASTIMDKIPATKFSYLSAKTLEWIKGNEKYLDPNVLSDAGCVVPTKAGPNWNIIIDETSPDRKPESIDRNIIEKYLMTKIPEFMTNEWYIKYIPSADHLVLALMGGLFISGNTFPEAVLLGIKTPEQFGWSKHDQLPEVVLASLGIVEDMKEQVIKDELSAAQSPVTEKMVMDSAKKYSVPMSYIMAIIKNDSTYGTKWLAVTTHNPGNVGNMDDGSTKDWLTREAGVDAVAENLQWRIAEYQKTYGNEKYPSLKELASNVGPDGKWFLSAQGNYLQENTTARLGAYMTADGWPDAVQNYQSDLSNEPQQI